MKSYRIFDLIFLGVLGIGSYLISSLLAIEMEQYNYYVKFGILVTFLSIVRWGRIGVLTFVIASLPNYYFLNYGILGNTLNILFAASLIFVIAIFVERINNKIIHAKIGVGFIIILMLYLAISISETLYNVILNGRDFFSTVQIIFSVYIFELVITVIVYIILRNVPSLFFNLKSELEHEVSEEV